MEDTPVISLFTSIFYENHKDSIKPDKIGVVSMINFATKEPSIISCTVNNGISAAINSRINKIKYTSKNPKTLPNKVFKVRKIGNLAKKSNIDAIICKTTFTAKKIMAKETAL